MVIAMLMKLCKCGRRIAQGQECTCRHKFYDKQSRDKSKKKFYGSTKWKKIVEAVRIRANGLYEYQLAVNGAIVIGTTVHHIYTTDERPDLKTDLSNLIFVSAQTHNMIHAEYKRNGESKSAMQKILWKIHNPFGNVIV